MAIASAMLAGSGATAGAGAVLTWCHLRPGCWWVRGAGSGVPSASGMGERSGAGYHGPFCINGSFDLLFEYIGRHRHSYGTTRLWSFALLRLPASIVANLFSKPCKEV